MNPPIFQSSDTRAESMLENARKKGVKITPKEVNEYLENEEKKKRISDLLEGIPPKQRKIILERMNASDKAYLKCQGWTRQQLSEEMGRTARLNIKMNSLDPISIQRRTEMLKEARRSLPHRYEEKELEKAPKIKPTRRK